MPARQSSQKDPKHSYWVALPTITSYFVLFTGFLALLFGIAFADTQDTQMMNLAAGFILIGGLFVYAYTHVTRLTKGIATAATRLHHTATFLTFLIAPVAIALILSQQALMIITAFLYLVAGFRSQRIFRVWSGMILAVLIIFFWIDSIPYVFLLLAVWLFWKR